VGLLVGSLALALAWRLQEDFELIAVKLESLFVDHLQSSLLRKSSA
jgi:hypothetical protein